jgi:hypothetical protein
MSYSGTKKEAPGAALHFMAATPLNLHVKTQKDVSKDFDDYMEGIITACCNGHSQGKALVSMSGGIVNAVTCSGGTFTAPPIFPMIMSTAPKKTPQELKYSKAIAQAFSDKWVSFVGGLKVPGLPWYPAFAAFPGPVAPPMPNVPTPLIAIPSSKMSDMSASSLKDAMVSNLGDKQALHHEDLFDAIAKGLFAAFMAWLPTQMVMNVLGTGPIPTFAPPYVPVGPVVGGSATGPPGIIGA